MGMVLKTFKRQIFDFIQRCNLYKKLLEHNMETGPLPADNLHIGAFRYYQEGKDYYIPILKKHGDKIKLPELAF